MERKTSLRTALGLLPAGSSGRVTYGVLTVGVLMAAESGRHESYPEIFVSAVAATLLYWLAHSYADLLGERLESGERLTTRALGRALAQDWAIARGSAVPLLAFAISWIVGASEEACLTASLWTAVAALVLLELLAGIRAGSRLAELVLKAAVGVTMGTTIVAVQALLH